MSSDLLGRWNDSDYSVTKPEKSKWEYVCPQAKSQRLVRKERDKGRERENTTWRVKGEL